MAKLTDKQKTYFYDSDFYKMYLDLLNSRLIYSNNSIEVDNNPVGDLYDYASVLSLEDNYKAFKILLNKLNTKEERPLTEELIIKVADTINKHADYISNGYRKTGKGHKLEGIYPIDDPEDIKKDMEKLLANYYGPWQKLDIFEREALFNIEFLRIHPFEDGNGRTSRLILNFNVLREGHAPIIIPERLREDYFYARDTENVNWIKNMFIDRSNKELIAIDKLIEEYEDENKITSSYNI